MNGKSTKEKPDQRRNHGRSQAVGGRSRNLDERTQRQTSHSGVRQEQPATNSPANSADPRPFAEQGAPASFDNSPFSGASFGHADSQLPWGGSKVSARTKRRLISYLYLVGLLAGVASLAIGLLILSRISANQTSNHNDTQNAVQSLTAISTTNEKTIICLVKLPLAQRTDANVKTCTTASQPMPTPTTPTATNTTTTTSTTTSPEVTSQSASGDVPVATPTPSQPVEVAPAPKQNIVGRILTSIKNLL